MSKFLGNNIRKLRDYYNESREELSKLLGYEMSTISNYELGYRVPDEDTLKRIAKHYNVSVDTLMNDDLTELEPLQLNIDIMHKFNNFYKVLFPVAKNVEDYKIEKFKDAYDTQLRLFSGEVDDIYNESFKIYDLYKELSETGNISSIVNMLSVSSFLKFYLINFTPENIQVFNESVDFNNNSITNEQFKKIVKNKLNNLKPEAKYKKEISNFITQCTEIIFGLIKDLKNQEKYYELADYYLAISCIYNLIDNDNTEIENESFGFKYMEILVKLGNKYAMQYFDMLSDIIDSLYK